MSGAVCTHVPGDGGAEGGHRGVVGRSATVKCTLTPRPTATSVASGRRQAGRPRRGGLATPSVSAAGRGPHRRRHDEGGRGGGEQAHRDDDDRDDHPVMPGVAPPASMCGFRHRHAAPTAMVPAAYGSPIASTPGISWRFVLALTPSGVDVAARVGVGVSMAARRRPVIRSICSGSRDLPPVDGVPDVEGVDDLVAEGGDPGRHDVEVEGEERGGDPVQQPDGVLGLDLDHRRRRRGGVVDGDPVSTGRGDDRPPAVGVGAGLLGQPLLERERAPQDGLELVGHAAPSRATGPGTARPRTSPRRSRPRRRRRPSARRDRAGRTRRPPRPAGRAGPWPPP